MANNSETPNISTLNQISEILKKLGLTKKEAEVYLYLASNHGFSSGRDISNRLKLHKGETYRILQSLQSRGIVEATIDRPMTYVGVPIEKVLDLHIETIRGQLSSLETEKKKMIAQFKSTTLDIPSFNRGKFLILKGQEMISAKSRLMGLEAKKDILSMYTNFDAVKFPKRASCHVKIRSLINISFKDIEKIKRLTASAIKNGFIVETRCMDIKKEMTYNVLIGEKSALLIWEPTLGEDMVAFWTDSEVFVHVWREFFEALWSKSIDMHKKLQQLEKQIGEGVVPPLIGKIKTKM